jgi:hypothetical protein
VGRARAELAEPWGNLVMWLGDLMWLEIFSAEYLRDRDPALETQGRRGVP